MCGAVEELALAESDSDEGSSGDSEDDSDDSEYDRWS